MAEIKESEKISGVIHVHPVIHKDDRGQFAETYRREWLNGKEMVQSSRSDKQANSLVGLHYHLKQADYWYVVNGRARVVLYDLRVGSPTENNSEIFELGDDNQNGVYIPPGVGHGFGALSDLTLTYLVDRYYDPEDEKGVAWDDPALGLAWGLESPIVSERDHLNPKLADIDLALFPRWN